MRDQKNTIMWAVGWWILRRALKKRAGGSSGGGVMRKLARVLIVAGLAGGAFVAWRRFGSGRGDGGSGPPPAPRPDPAPRTPAAV